MRLRLKLTAIAALCLALPAVGRAEDVFKIGSSLGLTGYAAVTDRAWRDGLQLAVDALNAKGGLLGRKLVLVIEDNRSEPQEAVVAYKKMMSSDQVQIFDSGCVSAGNFAAASSVVREKLPMILCSILPQRPEEQKWAFSFLAPPRFEIEARYRYLKEKTQIRKVGILHDPTPYALLMKDLGVKLAKDFGLEVVATESYKQDDADMSVQLGRINGAGGEAVIKMGQGGSTVTVAKNIKQLGLDKLLLLGSTDDGAIFRPAGEVLGDRFLFVAAPVQIPNSAEGATREAIDAFLKEWQPKYPDRDPAAGARAWDSMMVTAKAVELAKTFDGPAVRDAVEKVPQYHGAFATFNFSPEQHVGITENPYRMAVVKDGKFVFMP
jgi:ABC-type branched-subunit amino acid transport system substrate-binding protein